MKIEELEKELKEEKLASFYLFYGEEIFLLESNLKKIKKLFGERLEGINYITIDENNLEEIIPNLETPAFGYSKKLIIVKNSGLFKKQGKRKNARLEEIKEKLQTYLEENKESIQEVTNLIFIEEGVDKIAISSWFEKNGVVCKFDLQKPIQVQKRIKAICNAYHVNIEQAVLQYLIDSCGVNMQNVMNEVRKLIEYAGENGTIQKQDIDSLAIKQIESIIFDLTDELGKRKAKEAIDVLHGLMDQKEPIQKILITLYNHFKKVYFVKLAVKEGEDVVSVLNLKPNQTFLIGKYRTQAGYFKEEELQVILQQLIDLDYRYKIGKIDVKIGLEAILCRYCS